MFKSLWKSLGSSAPDSAEAQPAIERDKLKMLCEHFPVGRKLRYFPEYQRQIIFDTLIIAYRVNDQFIYSRDAVLYDDAGMPKGFQIDGRKVLPASSVSKLQLLLPDTTEAEKSLSYVARAELGRGGQFRIGNAVTLFVETEGRGIPTVDTVVDRRQTMNSGPYAGSPTILVSPDFETLVLADKRRKERIEAAIPAALFLTVGGEPFPCRFGDFSERSLRLRTWGEAQTMPEMEPGASVVVEFNLGDAGAVCRLRGRVFRRTDGFCVIDIEEVYKFGEFGRIEGMDIMEITTSLLNQGG